MSLKQALNEELQRLYLFTSGLIADDIARIVRARVGVLLTEGEIDRAGLHAQIEAVL